MLYSKFIIIIPTKNYFLYRVYKNNHINLFNINNQCTIIDVGSRFVAQAPKDLGYEPNEPNTMNLQRVGKRAGLLVNGPTASKDLKDEQMQKNTDKT